MQQYTKTDSLRARAGFPFSFSQTLEGLETEANTLPDKLCEELECAMPVDNVTAVDVEAVGDLLEALDSVSCRTDSSSVLDKLADWDITVRRVKKAFVAAFNNMTEQVKNARISGDMDTAEAKFGVVSQLFGLSDSLRLRKNLTTTFESEKLNISADRTRCQDRENMSPEAFCAKLRHFKSNNVPEFLRLETNLVDDLTRFGNFLQALQVGATHDSTQALINAIEEHVRHSACASPVMDLSAKIKNAHTRNAATLCNRLSSFTRSCSQAHYDCGRPLLEQVLQQWTKGEKSVGQNDGGQLARDLNNALGLLDHEAKEVADAIKCVESSNLVSMADIQPLTVAVARLQSAAQEESRRDVKDGPAASSLARLCSRLSQRKDSMCLQLTPTMTETQMDEAVCILNNVSQLQTSTLQTSQQLVDTLRATQTEIVACLGRVQHELCRHLEEAFVARDFARCNATYNQGQTMQGRLGQFCPVPPLDEMDNLLERIIEERVVVPAGTVDTATLCTSLIRMKELVRGITVDRVDRLIQKRIAEAIRHSAKNVEKLYDLGRRLHEAGALGAEIVRDHSRSFDAIITQERNKATAGMTPEHAVKELMRLNAGTDISEQEISGVLHAFFTHYEAALDDYLFRLDKKPLADLKSQVLHLAGKLAQSHKVQNKLVPELLAGIFAYWSVTTSAESYANGNKQGVKRPHAVQVLAIIRLLGLDSSESFISKGFRRLGRLWKGARLPDPPEGHLVELGTGEGKSVVLAAVSVCLALLGYDVNVACYSKNLSQRDEEAFKDLFQAFEVEDNVTYDTISDLAGKQLNSKGKIRDMALATIQSAGSAQSAAAALQPRPAILLLDEGDVFFSKSFCGESYNAITSLCNEHTAAIFRHLWAHKDTPLTMQIVQALPAFVALVQTVPADSRPLVDRALANALWDLRAYKANPAVYPYTVVDKKIAYADNDGQTTDTFYGYYTTFQYLEAEGKGQITDTAAVNRQLSLQFDCGSFSYAALPKEFEGGVLVITGTVKCLEPAELSMMRKDFHLAKQTVMPSMYGASKRDFKEESHVQLLDDEARFHQTLLDTALEASNAGRPVLIFFENETSLRAFQNSEYGRRLGTVEAITPLATPPGNVPICVKQATDSKRVTLWTREFGRGLDFICEDRAIDGAGGMRVIQAFFSSTASEETQVMGRTARMGKKGDFRMVLFTPAVAATLGWTEEQVRNANKSAAFLATLRQQRSSLRAAEVAELQRKIRERDHVHQTSVELRNALVAGNRSDSLRLLQQIEPSGPPGFDVLLVLDFSGSMSSFAAQAKTFARQIAAKFNIADRLSGNRLGLIAFGTESKVFAPLGSDLPTLEAAIANLPCMGGTNFGPPLKDCCQQFQDNGRPGQQRLVLFQTDGDNCDVQAGIEQARRVVNDMNANIFAIVVSTDAGVVEGSKRVVGERGCFDTCDKQALVKSLNDYGQLLSEVDNIVRQAVAKRAG